MGVISQIIRFCFCVQTIYSSHKWHWDKISVTYTYLEDIQYELALRELC